MLSMQKHEYVLMYEHKQIHGYVSKFLRKQIHGYENKFLRKFLCMMIHGCVYSLPSYLVG